MEKKELNKTVRRVSIIVCSILIVVSSYLLFNEDARPSTEEKKVPLYKYSSGSKITYEVFVKPSMFYDQNSLPQDKIYLREFTDYLQGVFEYKFTGERPADIQGDYEIVGIMEGFINASEPDKIKTLWQKQFIIQPKTTFNVKDSTLLLSKKIPIRFQEYSQYALNLLAQSKFKYDIKMTAAMNVKLKAVTDSGGVIEDTGSPGIIFPLTADSFEVTKNQTEEEPKALEKVEKIQVPVNPVKVTIFSVLIGIFLIGLIYLTFFTNPIVVDPLLVGVKKIFKKYGTRLVALNGEVVKHCSNVYPVKSIEDLVKIADEVDKPIMYKYSSEVRELTEFFILDNHCIYVFNLKENNLGKTRQRDHKMNYSRKPHKGKTTNI